MAKYGSKASLFQAIVRGPEPIRHPGSGVQIGRQRELLAEFGAAGPELKVTNEEGEDLVDPGTGRPIGRIVDVHGHFFDSVVQAKEKGWTDEEREMVEKRLDFLCATMPDQVWHLEDTKLPAPWPTYDSMHHLNLVKFAEQAGVLVEALAYEKQNKNRDGIVAGYEAALAKQAEAVQAEAVQAEDALTAA